MKWLCLCLFDFIDHSRDSNFSDPVNKKAVGKIKDELKWKIVCKFVGFKSKMCSLIGVHGEEGKKQKELIRMLLKTQNIKNLLMFCLIKINKTQNEK